MSNLGLERYLDGRRPEAGPHPGRRPLCRRADARSGFNVGGEQSGHIILSDFSTTGDGLLAALQVLAVLVRSRPAGERRLPRQFDPLPQKLRERPLRRRQAAGRRRA